MLLLLLDFAASLYSKYPICFLGFFFFNDICTNKVRYVNIEKEKKRVYINFNVLKILKIFQ